MVGNAVRVLLMAAGMGLASGMAAVAADAIAPVTYEQFGAKGDGVSDDRAAIVAAHEAANARGASVRAGDGKTYYVAGDEGTAIVKTDVDFGTARIVIDDSRAKKINLPLFKVVPSAEKIKVTGVSGLKRDQSNLGVRLPAKCFVQLRNDKVRRYIRFGPNRNDGTAQREACIVAKDGAIDPKTAPIWDYDEVTSVVATPMDEKTLVIKGGIFTTVANQAESKYTYHNRGFVINRSNVRIEGLRHEITGEGEHGAPYSGFLTINDCADVVVTGCVLTAHKTYRTIGSGGVPVSMGSYDLSVNDAINVSFIDSRQTTDINDNRYWGIFGSNFCKNLLFDGCVFSRFDAHMGVANATIRNSTLGYMGVHAIGCGTFLVENTTVRAGYFFELRPDYGSTWDGDFIVRNSTYVPMGGKSRPGVLVYGSNSGMHDFGYACTMPRKIVFDGLYIDDAQQSGKYAGPNLFNDYNGKMRDDTYVEKYPYKVSEEVVLRNVKTASGKEVRLGPNPYMFRNVKIVREK